MMPDRQTTQQNNKGLSTGVDSVRYRALVHGEWSDVTGTIVQESVVSIFANGQEIATMMATPRDQESLAVGYLYTEGLIQGGDEILDVSLAPNRTCVDVLLRGREIQLPPRRMLTSGCGKGVTFSSYEGAPIVSDLCVSPDQLQRLMQAMQQASDLHREAGGIHAAALASTEGLIVVMEDIGRHNTLDKIAGYCLLNGITTTDHLLLSTGRISSEMVNKALRMQLPLVASLSSSTSLAVERAKAYHLTLVGYVRGRRMRIYSHPERFQRTGQPHEK